MLKSCWQALLDLLYPPRCPACGSATPVQGAWCRLCLPELLPLRELAAGGRRPRPLSLCLTIVPYTGTVRQLLHRLKFRPDRRAAGYLAWLLCNRVNWNKLPPPELVIPVPLSPQREAWRGFNQTELLFRGWSEKQGYCWADLLRRRRDTQPQWQLPPLQRRRNIKAAFAVQHPEQLQGKTVLLVDDILTTGFTMAECARTLRRAGAGEVYGLALASGAADW